MKNDNIYPRLKEICGQIETEGGPRATYDRGWCDQRLADELGIPQQAVAGVRKSAFGPVLTQIDKVISSEEDFVGSRPAKKVDRYAERKKTLWELMTRVLKWWPSEGPYKLQQAFFKITDERIRKGTVRDLDNLEYSDVSHNGEFYRMKKYLEAILIRV